MAYLKPLILTFHGAFHLPVLLFAMLAVLAASFAFPNFSVSTMEPALLIRLSQLWSSLLSWFTPPCLFVVLNGIIVTLSATSGMLSGGPPCAGSSDFCPTLLNTKPGRPREISSAPIEGLSNRVFPAASLSAKMQKHTVRTLSMTVSALSINGPCKISDARETCQEEDVQFYDAEDEADTKEEDEGSHEFSERGMKSASLSFCCEHSKIDEKQEDGDEFENGSETPCIHARQKKIALFYREDGDFVQRTSRSVPCGLHFAKPPKTKSIQRSLSVDSAPYDADQASSNFLSAESLSDEAFRKRVEDFISRMNAQLRNEVE